jgi:hypothetical protein
MRRLFEPISGGARKPKRRANSARLSPDGKLQLSAPEEVPADPWAAVALETGAGRVSGFADAILLMGSDSLSSN